MKLKAEFPPPVAATPSSQKVSATPRPLLENHPLSAAREIVPEAAHSSFGDVASPPRLLRKILVAATALAPSPLFACAACYGKSDSALATGMNWGILTLLGVVLTVLTCIALFFVHIVRKEEASSNPPPPANDPSDL